MGGRGRSRTQRKHFKQSREDVWKFSSKSGKSDAPPADLQNQEGDTTSNTTYNGGWEALRTQNAAFEDYYKEQGIVEPEEWDTFIEILRKPLPAAFRINSSGQFCLDIRSQLEDDFVKSLQSEFIDEEEAEALRPLPWYPENFAWHSNYSRKQLRKTQTLERFHEFLKLAHEIGNITRQEAVSMVPPLFLDVRSDHSVLDMCAAPGSKTFQLLEIIHRANEHGSLPSGMVVANDVDVQRSNLLIHQTKRMCTANLIVTNHEAQHFPGCRLSKSHHDSSEVESTNGLSIDQLLFDRVLCDVPCSGDGTLRKAPDIWRRWNSGMGNGLHGLQLKIAMRGLSLLKVGGRMIYSTCSMNPVENEAVVAEILRRCGDSVELLDVSGELPQLVRRPGLKKWKVRDKGLWLSSYKDVPERRRPGVLPSMFPSGRNTEEPSANGDTGGNIDAECVAKPSQNSVVSPSEVGDDVQSSLPLERCVRILPHDQNSGAFFIAVFHKRSSLPVVQELSNGLNRFSLHKDKELAETTRDKLDDHTSTLDEVLNGRSSEMVSGAGPVDTQTKETSLDNDPVQTMDDEASKDEEAVGDEDAGMEKTGMKRKLQIQGKWKGVDPVILFKDETVINSIKTFYGILDSFPLDGHLVSRNSDTESVKRIYYISKSVKDVLELNLAVGQQLKIASVGLKMFERQTSKDGNSSNCRYRISSEGLPLLLPYITKQILVASLAGFKRLLEKKSLKFGDFIDAELNERASNLELGCCVVVLRQGEGALTVPLAVDSSTIAIGCWRGRSNVNVMVSGLDCQDLLERLETRFQAAAAAQGVSEPLDTGATQVTVSSNTDMKEQGMKKDEETIDMVGV